MMMMMMMMMMKALSIIIQKIPSCTLYVTLNVKKIQKLVRVFDRWQKRETTQNSSHIIACASQRRFKTNVLLLLSQ